MNHPAQDLHTYKSKLLKFNHYIIGGIPGEGVITGQGSDDIRNIVIHPVDLPGPLNGQASGDDNGVIPDEMGEKVAAF